MQFLGGGKGEPCVRFWFLVENSVNSRMVLLSIDRRGLARVMVVVLTVLFY